MIDLGNKVFRERVALTVVAIAFVAMTAIPWVKIARRPHGDFVNHCKFGGRFVRHEDIYAHGLNYPYPPLWAMAHAPLSLAPVSLVQPLTYVLGPMALVAILAMATTWSGVIERRGREAWLWVIGGTLLATARFIIRDFDECGPNLALAALTFGAAWLWSRKQDHWASAALGTAIALKCTAAAMLAYFLWKRQWRVVLLTSVVALGLTTLPMAYSGSSLHATRMSAWIDTVLRGVREPDPSLGVLGPQPLANKSLRPALARYLMRLPDGHPGRVAGPGIVDVLDLSPRAAGVMASAATFALAAMVLWGTRRVGKRRDDPANDWAAASVMLLALLASPITWGHHMVAAIPAVFLLVDQSLDRSRRRAANVACLTVFTLVSVILNRDLVGPSIAAWAESYHLLTIGLILLLAATTTSASARRAATSSRAVDSDWRLAA